ncbi:MAG: kinase [Candidatus Egerieousia sp.]
MEVFKGNICVTVAELTDTTTGEAVMSRSNYDILVYRRRLLVARAGKGMDNHALIDWQSLPERFKSRYIAKYGDRAEELKNADNAFATDTAAYEYFSSLGLKEDKIDEYTLNASVLRDLIRRRDTQSAYRGLCGNRTPIFWEGLMNECEQLRQQHGHTLPKSTYSLRKKMRQYEKEGYSCLVSGKLNNTNSIKISDEAAECLIALKRSHFPVYNTTQIFDKFNEVAAERGWKPLKSVKAVLSFLNTPEIRSRWIDGAYGSLIAKKALGRRHTTVLPERRDSVWYGDGTKLNLYYKAYVGGKWKAATLYVFEVVDAYSEVLLGYKVGTSEDFEMMYWAYRNAVEYAGHLPVELVHDSQGGTKRDDAKSWMSKIARFTRPCTPQNPTSKTIEAIFGRFQSQVLHTYWNYTGGNIQAKSMSSKVDTDRILANVQSLPTYSELLEIYAEARQRWNTAVHPKYKRSRLELYQESANEESIELTPAVAKNIFWLTTRSASTYTADGIKIQVEGQTYRYEVFGTDGMPDLEFNLQNIGRRFKVQYDPADLSSVRLCIDDPNYGLQFVVKADTKVVIHRAMQEQSEGERSFIRRQDAANKKLQVFIYLDGQELDRRYGQSFDQHGMRDPKLPGVTKAEFEKYAQEWVDKRRREPRPAEVLPDTIAQVEKEQSNMTAEMTAGYNRANRL